MSSTTTGGKQFSTVGYPWGGEADGILVGSSVVSGKSSVLTPIIFEI